MVRVEHQAWSCPSPPRLIQKSKKGSWFPLTSPPLLWIGRNHPPQSSIIHAIILPEPVSGRSSAVRHLSIWNRCCWNITAAVCSPGLGWVVLCSVPYRVVMAQSLPCCLDSRCCWQACKQGCRIARRHGFSSLHGESIDSIHKILGILHIVYSGQVFCK